MNKAILSIISDGLSAAIAYGCAALPGGETVTISELYTVSTLGSSGLTWYNYIDSEKTVEICSYMKGQATAGNQIFYDIYTAEEKAADPKKEDTGLFFLKGEPGAKFAICNAGGGFAYVGAMHDSFPHALELRKKRIKRNGTDAEIEVFEGLPHGFWLGTGTVAEGWIDRAVAFWER